MAIKDFTGSENEDRDANKKTDLPPEELKQILKDNKDVDAAEIKNAHATGDGSFGRSESSLPEGDENESKGNAAY